MSKRTRNKQFDTLFRWAYVGVPIPRHAYETPMRMFAPKPFFAVTRKHAVKVISDMGFYVSYDDVEPVVAVPLEKPMGYKAARDYCHLLNQLADGD